jgi:hypothetical protein
MKTQQVSEELWDMRWPQQKTKLLKLNNLIALRCGGSYEKRGSPKNEGITLNIAENERDKK